MKCNCPDHRTKAPRLDEYTESTTETTELFTDPVQTRTMRIHGPIEEVLDQIKMREAGLLWPVRQIVLMYVGELLLDVLVVFEVPDGV